MTKSSELGNYFNRSFFTRRRFPPYLPRPPFRKTTLVAMNLLSGHEYDRLDAMDDAGILKPALAVHDDGDDDDDPDDGGVLPVDGMAYLKQVRKEARKLEEVKVASEAELQRKRAAVASASRQPGNYVDRAKAGLPARFVPSDQWQDEQVRRFADLRQRLARHMAALEIQEEADANAEQLVEKKKKPKLPKKTDEKGWCTFLYGPAFWPRLQEARASDQSDSSSPFETTNQNANADTGHPPTTELVSSLRPSLCESIFDYHVGWLESLGELPEGGSPRLRGLPAMGPWLYALMARLEVPLYPDTSSGLRTVALVCSRQRLGLVGDCHGTAGDGPELDVVTALTMFVCLVAKFFGQADLADN